MNISTRSILIGIAIVAALMLAWQLATILLLVFAGLLMAALLDAIVQPFNRLLPVPRIVLVVFITLVIVVLAIAGLSMGGVSLWQDLVELWTMVADQTIALYERWGEQLDLSLDASEEGSLVRTLLPDPTGLFSQAGSIFGVTLGVLGNVVIIMFLGLFFAADPKGYRDGFLLLFPIRHREKLQGALDSTGQTLRGWLVTQLAVMVLIGVLVFALLTLLGSENALLLGILAGLLNFIPYLGPIISAVPVLLTLAGQDMTVFLIGALGLLLVQNLEGYVITPMLQKHIIHLPPAWSLIVIALMGTLFGPLGVALATPLFAVGRTLTQKLYLETRDEGPSTA